MKDEPIFFKDGKQVDPPPYRGKKEKRLFKGKRKKKRKPRLPKGVHEAWKGGKQLDREADRKMLDGS